MPQRVRQPRLPTPLRVRRRRPSFKWRQLERRQGSRRLPCRRRPRSYRLQRRNKRQSSRILGLTYKIPSSFRTTKVVAVQAAARVAAASTTSSPSRPLVHPTAGHWTCRHRQWCRTTTTTARLGQFPASAHRQVLVPSPRRGHHPLLLGPRRGPVSSLRRRHHPLPLGPRPIRTSWPPCARSCRQ